MAADPAGAMLHSSGPTSVNGTDVQRSSAVFPGDVVRTGNSAEANITASGASVTIAENSAIRFETSGVSVVEGSINIGTARRNITVQAGTLSVAPASGVWTEFEISHRNGAVQVMALKGDLAVSAGTHTFTLLQGQSDTRGDSDANSPDDRRRKKRRDDQPAPAASRPVIDSPVLIAVGAAAITGGLIYVLTRSGAPVSPTAP